MVGKTDIMSFFVGNKPDGGLFDRAAEGIAELIEIRDGHTSLITTRYATCLPASVTD